MIFGVYAVVIAKTFLLLTHRWVFQSIQLLWKVSRKGRQNHSWQYFAFGNWRIAVESSNPPMLTQDLAVILNWLGFAWPKHRIQQVLSQVEMPCKKNLKQTRRSDFGSITVLSDLSYHIVYILYIYKYIYQSIEAWGMWSFLEVSTSSTGSRMDPHSFIVCMRKVRETELEAATVCPAAVSNKSWNETRHLETFPCQMVQDILKRHDSNNSGTIYMRQAGGKRVCFFPRFMYCVCTTRGCYILQESWFKLHKFEVTKDADKLQQVVPILKEIGYVWSPSGSHLPVLVERLESLPAPVLRKMLQEMWDISAIFEAWSTWACVPLYSGGEEPFEAMNWIQCQRTQSKVELSSERRCFWDQDSCALAALAVFKLTWLVASSPAIDSES